MNDDDKVKRRALVDHADQKDPTTGSVEVAAIIVTYNRKDLLARCIEAVLRQARPVDKVIVVDNCSTDGTPELLARHGHLQNPAFEYIRLPENTGSAGGFHEGMKWAYEQGFDWLWVMDDDGMPQPDTLDYLLDCPQHVLFRGCLVLSSEDPTRQNLAFGLLSTSGWIRSTKDIPGPMRILPDEANPFNGVLVSREVIRRVGLPCRELFIWGDESEYLLRARAAGVTIGTVIRAKFLHPPDRMLFKRLRLHGREVALPYSNDPLRFYLIVRNSAYARLRHCGPFSAAFLKILVYPVLFPRKARLAASGLIDGIIGRLEPINRLPGKIVHPRGIQR